MGDGFIICGNAMLLAPPAGEGLSRLGAAVRFQIQTTARILVAVGRAPGYGEFHSSVAGRDSSHNVRSVAVNLRRQRAGA